MSALPSPAARDALPHRIRNSGSTAALVSRLHRLCVHGHLSAHRGARRRDRASRLLSRYLVRVFPGGGARSLGK